MSDPGWINHAKGPVSNSHYNEQAIDRGLGLLHWDDIAPLDTDDYKGLHWKAESELNQFSQIVVDDQLTVTFYNPLSRITIAKPRDVCIIPASGAELLDPIPIEPYGSADVDETEHKHVFKAVRFAEETIVEVTPAAAPALFDTDLHPRHWAACDWGQINNEIVLAAHQGEPLPWEPSSLTPTQVEICGEEYLRLEHPSFRRISTLGGEQKDVDVIGYAGTTNREVIVAEMTGGTTTDDLDRRDRLRKHEDYADTLYLFAPEESRPESIPSTVGFVSLERMFQQLVASDRTEQMIREMLMYHHA